MSIKKNFAYNFLYQIFHIIIPLITMPYLARVIGVEGVGVYSYTNAIANYFILFAMLGLNNYGNRSIAKVRDDKILLSKTFWSIYLLQVITSLSVALSYIAYIFVIRPQHFQLSLIFTIYVFSTILDINWLFFGLEKFKLTVLRNTFIKAFTVFLIFVLVKNEADLKIYSLIMAISFPISHLMIWPYLRKVVVWVKPSFPEICQHIKPNLLLFIPVISISIYKIMDKVMIGSLSSVIQLGYYENAEKINSVQVSLATALGTVMLPRMSNLVARGLHEEYKSLIYDSMQFVLFMSTALCFGLISISNEFIPLFLGEKFYPSSDVLVLLAPTGIFIAWANVIRTQYLIPNHEDGIYVKSVILGAVINIILNFFLIPIYGALGAAIGTLFAEAAVMLYQTIAVRKVLAITQYVKSNIIFVPIGIIMVLGVRLISILVGSTVIGITIQVITGAIIYVLLSAVYFYIFDRSRFVYFAGTFKSWSR